MNKKRKTTKKRTTTKIITMKNILRFIAWLSLVILVFACKSKAPTLNNSTDIQSSIDKSRVSSVKYWNFQTLPINDLLQFSVPKIQTNSTDKNCDSICNSKMREVLAQMNTEKSSGNNRYKWYYDHYNDKLKLIVQLEGNEKILRDSINDLKSSSNQVIKEKVEIPVPFDPSNWQSFLMVCGKIFLGILAVCIIYLGIKFTKKSSI